MSDSKSTTSKSTISSPACEWASLEDALGVLRAHVKAQKGTHVLWSSGTVTAVDDTKLEFAGFKNYRFPVHRVHGDEALARLYLALNQKTYEEQKGKHAAIPAAYELLVADGYPYPGNNLADRIVSPLWTAAAGVPGTWRVSWPNRDKRVYNLVTSMSTPAGQWPAADTLAADLRRYDYMTPNVYAVVDADSVTRVSKERPPGDKPLAIRPPAKSEYPFTSLTTNPALALRT